MLKRLFIEESRENGLKKRRGDDKLVISLVLIAVGVVLCFFYRTEIQDVITSAVKALSTKIDEMFDFSDTTTTSGLVLPMGNLINLFKF